MVDAETSNINLVAFAVLVASTPLVILGSLHAAIRVLVPPTSKCGQSFTEGVQETVASDSVSGTRERTTSEDAKQILDGHCSVGFLGWVCSFLFCPIAVAFSVGQAVAAADTASVFFLFILWLRSLVVCVFLMVEDTRTRITAESISQPFVEQVEFGTTDSSPVDDLSAHESDAISMVSSSASFFGGFKATRIRLFGKVWLLRLLEYRKHQNLEQLTWWTETTSMGRGSLCCEYFLFLGRLCMPLTESAGTLQVIWKTTTSITETSR